MLGLQFGEQIREQFLPKYPSLQANVKDIHKEIKPLKHPSLQNLSLNI